MDEDIWNDDHYRETAVVEPKIVIVRKRKMEDSSEDEMEENSAKRKRKNATHFLGYFIEL